MIKFKADSLNIYAKEGNSIESTGNTKYPFGEVNKSELDSNQIFHEGHRAERYGKHFLKGHRLFGFKNENQIISYIWASLLPNNIIYFWDCRTDNSYRGNGLYPLGLTLLSKQFSNNSQFYICCSDDNEPSKKGILKANFKFKKRIRVIYVWRFTITIDTSFPFIRIYYKNPYLFPL